MIARVIERALQSSIKDILVAAGDEEIIAPSEYAGAKAVLTDPLLPSGSDRVLAAIDLIDKENFFDIVINLQGDMPTFDPKIIDIAIECFKANRDADIITLVSPSNDENEKQDPNLVKAIIANFDETKGGQCLYFTRANAPWGEGDIYRHVGLYLYKREALRNFVTAKPSKLEQREKLEQLRALELGMKIYAGVVKEFPKGVDTPENLETAREFYRNNNG